MEAVMAASDQTPRPKARKKPVRTLRVLADLASGSLLVEVEERNSKSFKLTHYYVDRLEADFGKAFRFAKFEIQGGEVYAVNVGGEGEPASCECVGHLKHGHKTTCRHVAAARALIEAGKLA